MKAAGYPRVSTGAQELSGFSLDDQVASIERFCKENNIQLVAHFMEQESAATIRNRPSFKAAMRFVLKNPDIDALVVSNLDRFSRSVLDAELIRGALAKHGKKLISVQEQYLTPVLERHEDDYMEAALQHRMVEAEQERKRIRRRFLRGKKQKVQNGGWAGFRPPFEYDVIQGELVLNPERAKTVKLISRLRNLGMTYIEIADYLNGANRWKKIWQPPHAKVPQRKRNRPPKLGTGKWTRYNVRNIAIRFGKKTWGAGSGRQGILKAV